MTLSPKVKELIAKARIVSVSHWQEAYSGDLIALFQKADDEGRYLDDADLQTLQTQGPNLASALEIAKTLRDHASDIVDDARAQVLTQFPGITEPGGGLYPAIRAEACWRDFWHFLRCITYGIAAQRNDFTSAIGLQYMEELYQELQVPLDAMVFGLKALKTSSLKRLSDQIESPVETYFDHLIQALAAF